MSYTVLIDESYVVPTGPLTKDQYINFVMNRASESYSNQYGTASKEDGIQAACDAYNAALPPEPAPEPAPE